MPSWATGSAFAPVSGAGVPPADGRDARPTASFLVRESRDARFWQVAALGLLLGWNIATLSLGASLLPSLVAIAAALAAQLAARFAGLTPSFDLRSALITGCSLALLIRGDGLWVPALAAAIGIGGKAVFRVRGKHLWNPAALGISVLLLTGHAWVSPGQWGTGAFIVLFIVFAGILVLSRAARLDTALAFPGADFALLLLRAAWLGDPLRIPLHQVQNGALLLFAFFMITDPRTTPDDRRARIGFAVAVATLAYWLSFSLQLRPALYLALVSLAPLVPVLDALFPAAAFRWRPNPEFAPIMSKPLHRLARTAALALAGAGALATSITPALAFCGFYVAQADAKLFNTASKVVLAWDNGQASVTMASDYQGDPKEFALVVPVPTVVAEDDIRVVENNLIDKLDAYSAPRLTEYFDSDPCPPDITLARRSASVGYTGDAAGVPAPLAMAEPLGVTIEARYQVGVYDILILSAKESDGLVTWLAANNYKIPEGAEDVLGSYIKQGMHFFVAKVNLDRQAQAGEHFLRPLQVSYQTRKFMLPIRLGTVNANGPQDMIVFILSRKGRVETTNYQTTKMASGQDVPLFAKDQFGAVYKAAFDKAVADDGMTKIYEEYAWDMRGFMPPCDPCSAPVPNATDLYALGARWHYPDMLHAGPAQLKTARFKPAQNDAYLTRLHVRYDAGHFPEDLAFTETSDRTPFQVVYKLKHPWIGASRCRAGDDYLRSLPPRFQREADNLVRLTGWDPVDVHDKMHAGGQPFDIRPPGLIERLLR
jgi:Na+-translocating ferredoxin:NAD+ oxidoreductase RnfD subunit